MECALLELTRRNIEASKLDERALAFLRTMSATSLTVIRDMLPRGNRFLAGCDGGVPGFCLHDELQALTDAGLSPLQAIQTATINPARLLGRENMQGTIKTGNQADIVLLEADPRTDIRNTRRIRAVIAGGRLLSKADIDRIIAARRRPAGRQRSRKRFHPALVGQHSGMRASRHWTSSSTSSKRKS